MRSVDKAADAVEVVIPKTKGRYVAPALRGVSGGLIKEESGAVVAPVKEVKADRIAFIPYREPAVIQHNNPKNLDTASALDFTSL